MRRQGAGGAGWGRGRGTRAEAQHQQQTPAGFATVLRYHCRKGEGEAGHPHEVTNMDAVNANNKPGPSSRATRSL